MFRAHQSRRATRRGRRKTTQNSLREPFGKLVCQSRAKNPFRTLSESSWSVSGAARECFWTAFGHSWPAWGVPRSALGRHLGVQKPSRARPGASPKRLWAPKPAQDRFFFDLGSIWDGFSQIFERFFVDFRSRHVRRRHKTESQKGVVRSSPRVLALALHSRFVLPVRLSKRLANVTCSVFFRCVPTSPPVML